MTITGGSSFETIKEKNDTSIIDKSDKTIPSISLENKTLNLKNNNTVVNHKFDEFFDPTKTEISLCIAKIPQKTNESLLEKDSGFTTPDPKPLSSDEIKAALDKFKGNIQEAIDKLVQRLERKDNPPNLGTLIKNLESLKSGLGEVDKLSKLEDLGKTFESPTKEIMEALEKLGNIVKNPLDKPTFKLDDSGINDLPKNLEMHKKI